MRISYAFSTHHGGCMAKIISLINQKGGCGKTVSTYNIAATLAEKGYKVLMIDNDQQGSLTIYSGYNPNDFENTLERVYLGQIPAVKAIYDTRYENLFLIPANIGLAKVDMSLTGQARSGRNALGKMLEPIREAFDFILIDCPPALSMLTINALACSDYTLIPCQTNPLCTAALHDLFETIENIQALTKHLQVLGILATMHQKSASVYRKELEKLEENYNVLGVIKLSSVVSDSIISGEPVVRYKRSSEVAKQYIEATEHLLEEMGVDTNGNE